MLTAWLSVQWSHTCERRAGPHREFRATYLYFCLLFRTLQALGLVLPTLTHETHCASMACCVHMTARAAIHLGQAT